MLLSQYLYKSATLLRDLDLAEQWFNQSPNIYRFKLLYEITLTLDIRERAEAPLHTLLSQQLSSKDQAQLIGVLGQVHFSKGEFHDAVACYQLAAQIEPDNISNLFNLGMMYEQIGRYDESLKNYKLALAKDPEHPGTHNNLALLMLRLMQFEEGWRHHEWRWAIPGQSQFYQQFNIPRWRGESLEGKSLIVWAEQGIGDHIMYGSLLDDLLKRGGTVHYEIYARLDDLFARTYPDVNFIRGKEEGQEFANGVHLFKHSWPTSDYQIPLASLPGILRPHIETFPVRESFLTADLEETAEFSSRYANQFADKRLIGISWRGGKTILTERQSRRIRLETLKLLQTLPSIQLIDLQYDSTPEEREEAASLGLNLYHDDSVDARINLDRQASQIAALDAVISIDNTTVHLAGALGIPTFALLPLNPNWRWGLEEGRSYWYSSVRLFRNREMSDWTEALARVCQALKDENLV
ncbi:tetratricopeptide repeat protein [Pseudomonas sp. S31]|nr:tetratricopeptide repeat protein [Pseudomonas sp. S31]